MYGYVYSYLAEELDAIPQDHGDLQLTDNQYEKWQAVLAKLEDWDKPRCSKPFSWRQENDQKRKRNNMQKMLVKNEATTSEE